MSRSAMRLIVQKWRPFVLPLILFGLPPYASKGYALLQIGSVNSYILTHSIKGSFQPLYPVFKILPIALGLSLLLFGKKSAKLFGLCATVSYILFGFLQGISLGEEYGLGISLAHLALSLLIAVSWLDEMHSPRNDFTVVAQPLWKYWVVLPAVLAFWEPANPVTGSPDFNPAYLLTSGAGLAFCMMTPFYLAVLILCHPRTNPTILATTSVIGVLYGLGNMTMAFFFNSGRHWWIGVLHLPLLILALHGLVLSIGDTFARPISIETGKAH